MNLPIPLNKQHPISSAVLPNQPAFFLKEKRKETQALLRQFPWKGYAAYFVFQTWHDWYLCIGHWKTPIYCFFSARLRVSQNARNLNNRQKLLLYNKNFWMLMRLLYILFVCMRYKLTLQWFQSADLANKCRIRKFDRYIIISYSSVAPNADFLDIYKLTTSTFQILPCTMFFVYPLRVIIVTTFSVAMLCAEGDTQGKPRESRTYLTSVN